MRRRTAPTPRLKSSPEPSSRAPYLRLPGFAWDPLSRISSQVRRPTLGHAWRYRRQAASLRRLEPELAGILLSEALSVANVPPSTSWAEAPVAVTAPPAPLTTKQLIPQAMVMRLHTFRRKVAECLATARDGRWRVARTQRPEPFYAAGIDCVLPAGRGWAWRFVKEDELWYPLMPSA